jgi:hypothetical protein
VDAFSPERAVYPQTASAGAKFPVAVLAVQPVATVDVTMEGFIWVYPAGYQMLLAACFGKFRLYSFP